LLSTAAGDEPGGLTVGGPEDPEDVPPQADKVETAAIAKKTRMQALSTCVKSAKIHLKTKANAIIKNFFISFRQFRGFLRAIICVALTFAWLGQGPLSAQQITPSPDYERLFSIALERLNESRPVAAQWWLRRALRYATTEAERAALRDAFRQIADAKRLTLNFGFNVAPSSNINGGTNLEFFSLGDIDLIFGPESRALSGTEVSGHIDLAYRLARGPRYETSANLYVYGRSYRLSPESQASVPDVSGSDYAYLSGDLALRHRWMMLDGLGPTSVSVSLGRVDYGGKPLYSYRKVAANQDFRLRRGLLSIGASFEDQKTESNERLDAQVVETRAALALQTAQGGIWRWTLMGRKTQSLLSTEVFDEVQASASLTPSWSVLGAVPTLSIGLGTKDYDDFILSFDGRRDQSASLGLSLRLDRASVMGFAPVLNLTGTRTWSNIARYDMTVFTANLGLQSQF
jgi:hypothetical protein